jgi:transcription-repair coupling factor (superfamily II helicase)
LIRTETESTQVLRIGGLPGGSEAWWLWKNREELGRTLVLCSSDEHAQALYDDFQALSRWASGSASVEADAWEDGAVYFPDDEKEDRIPALTAWSGGGDAGKPTAQFLIASHEMTDVELPSPEAFASSHRKIRIGDRADREKFLASLGEQGYNRVDTVENVGECAVRGEVVDLWSPGWDSPVRLLWPYDQIESVRKIDLTTQRSGDAVDALMVKPAQLTPSPFPSRGEGKNSGEIATLLSYLGAGGTLFESELPADVDIAFAGRRIKRIGLESAEREEPYRPPPTFGSPARMDLFAKAVKDWLADGWTVHAFCRNQGEQERLEEILLEHDRRLAGDIEARRIDFPLGPLMRGFLDPVEKRAVLANGQIFGRARRRLRLPKFVGGKALAGVAELRGGDYVVHERFGIGRYRKLERVKAGGVEADYLRLEYKGGDRVFVPLTEFRQVQKYIGTEGKKPKVSSLDTASWERTKKQVEESVAQLAAELLERAAKRAALPGIGFAPDSHLEKEFGASFLYELTPDQAKAIDEVRSDMMRPRPMDRLVCGDVGYGKTEVALRAAFKAVSNGRQVAVLVPTTILADQHGRNFRERFADYPVSVAVLSRFAKPAEVKSVLADLRRGVIDIVVGTHRLLSADVVFKNLGLVIIDEEHRFGVKQKERIMAYRDVVDVLALSATPIPRTMGAALGGIKSLSVIESPPEGRLPIATHVGPFDEKIVLAAVEHELRRSGQVFYVHNRIGTIEKRKEWLEQVMAAQGLNAKVGLGHGQMTGPQLEKTMWDFLHKKFNILLSTTIIESGLDIPSVNTLVVEDAEDFGLSQLYQLRGRVGRQREKAYCYLFYSPGAELTEDARKRLTALKEFASLGSGFRLALRDLEIRGAGNLLGPQQHGFVNAVGIDLYGQLLADQIARQKGEAPARPEEPEPALELPVSAFLPEDYLPSEAERVAFYKRLLDASEKDLDGLREELLDRCGALPDPAERLFQVAALRLAARRAGALSVAVARKGLEVRFREGVTFPPALLEALPKSHGSAFSFLPGPPAGAPSDKPGRSPAATETFGMRFGPPLPGGGDLLGWTRDFLLSLTAKG